MKKVMLISALALVVVSSAFANHPEGPVKVISTKMDVVYFKVNCSLIGATMEVRDNDGKVIFSEKVVDHKVLVDFFAEPSGNYTIHLVKDGHDDSISYSKFTISQAERASGNYVTVTQM